MANSKKRTTNRGPVPDVMAARDTNSKGPAGNTSVDNPQPSQGISRMDPNGIMNNRQTLRSKIGKDNVNNASEMYRRQNTPGSIGFTPDNRNDQLSRQPGPRENAKLQPNSTDYSPQSSTRLGKTTMMPNQTKYDRQSENEIISLNNDMKRVIAGKEVSQRKDRKAPGKVQRAKNSN